MQPTNQPDIRLVEPRATVEVHLPDKRVLSGPRNTEIGKLLYALPEASDPPIVGAVVNNELRELTYPIKIDSTVRPVTMSEADGMRIYRRSLVFLLATAFYEQFPGAVLRVDHSVSSGGYYCQVLDRPPLSQQELSCLEEKMRQIATANLPFIRSQVPLAEAIEYFKAQGEEEKVRLLVHRNKSYLTLYQLFNYRDYFHGYMVPSSGYLKWFNLSPTGEGFTLHFPRRHAPTYLQPIPEYPKLLHTFQQYGSWLDSLGIADIGALNDAIKEERTDEIILVSEALHEQNVTEIASEIARRRGQVRVVTIAGPSSSGKTTFSKRLSVQLLAFGLAPFPLAMDDYFIDRDLTPLDENGEPDFESIRALNQDQLSKDLRRLIAGEAVQLPHYNFLTGRSSPGNIVHLKNNEIIILEGIHGLNPELLSELPEQQTFRIFASALTQLNLDRHNRISTTDTRLLRRIVRDARERGYRAYQTIQRWESVRRGEKRHIFPYQENADVIFNSALVYELSALKPFAEPLLLQVHFGSPEYIESKRLLAFLEWFQPINTELIPDNSILREFIGGSILRDFSLWSNHQNK